MPSIIKYIENYKNVSFQEEPLNEVDILILNELLYLPFDDYLIKEITIDFPMKMNHLYTLYWLNHQKHHQDNPFLATTDRHRLFTQVASSSRYEDVRVSDFVNYLNLNTEKQFCAATFTIDQTTLLVVFRGTDDTLIGWKEDLKLAYQKTIPAQEDAKHYLESILSLTNKTILVSGHSKGGNLALYASMEVKDEKDLIRNIYLFDSPGLSKAYTESEHYLKKISKVRRYIPDDSIVGKMMYHNIEPIIIKSNSIGLMQHNTVHWQTEENHLKRENHASESSIIIDTVLKNWTDRHSNEDLEIFVEHTFNLLNETGITTLNEITQDPFGFLKTLKHVKDQDVSDEKDKVIELRRSFISCWHEAKKRQLQDRWEQVQENIKQVVETMTPTVETKQTLQNLIDNFSQKK